MRKATIVFIRPAGTVNTWRDGIAVMLTVVWGFVFFPALAAEQPLLTPLTGNKPRLAKLEIEIWPEYDRPAALVFLRGELASPVSQPLALRLPFSSGGPSAVAHSSSADGNLFNLTYERADAKDFITIRIQPPGRFFHVEFYDTLNASKEKREYRYSWPGDMPADQLSVQVQQPAGALEFEITPQLDSAAGPDGMIYWTKDMGAAPAGKAVPVTVRYTKTDARSSKEQLAALNPASATQEPASPAAADSQASSNSKTSSGDPLIYLVTALAFTAVVAAAVVLLWLRRRVPAGSANPAAFCNSCGNPLRAEDRFCSNCGKKASK